MFDLFKKKSNILPVDIEKMENVEQLVPSITDPLLLKEKRGELSAMIKRFAEDGNITVIEYQEMHDLAVQIGVNDAQIELMVKDEFKEQLKKQIKLFASDCKIDRKELSAIMCRAKDIGMSKGEVEIVINEALSAQREIYAKQKKIQSEKDAKEFSKNLKIALGVAFGTVVTAGVVISKVANSGSLRYSIVQHLKS